MARRKKPLINTAKKGIVTKSIGMGILALGLGTAVAVKVIPGMKAKLAEQERARIEQVEKDKQYEKQLTLARQKKHNEADIRRIFGRGESINIANLASPNKYILDLSYLSHERIKEYYKKNKTRLINNHKPISKKQSMENKKILEPLVRKAAKKYGINEDTFVQLIQLESKWDPFAVSYAGASGLGQLMPSIWDSKYDASFHCNPFNPVQNIDIAAKTYADLLVRFKREDLALTAYNAGIKYVLDGIKAGLTPQQIVNGLKTNYYKRVKSQK